METQATQTQPRGEYRLLEKPRWANYFATITEALQGKRAEIEVAGLDLGDQIEAEHIVLNGVTYDHKDDTLYIYAADAGSDLDHAIAHPREIVVSSRTGILDRIVVKDAESHLHVITLREALELPAPTETAE
jgi:hypothetical protein